MKTVLQEEQGFLFGQRICGFPELDKSSAYGVVSQSQVTPRAGIRSGGEQVLGALNYPIYSALDPGEWPTWCCKATQSREVGLGDFPVERSTQVESWLGLASQVP